MMGKVNPSKTLVGKQTPLAAAAASPPSLRGVWKVLGRVSLLIRVLSQLGRCWEPNHPELGTEISAALGESCLCQCQTGTVLEGLAGRGAGADDSTWIHLRAPGPPFPKEKEQ